MRFKSESEQRNTEFIDNTMGRLLGLPPQKERLIDKIEAEPRVLPMRVLCLGLSRTGTVSMDTALKQLGYRPYHMTDAVTNSAVVLPLWEEALDAKYNGKGIPWTKEDFDKILGTFDVCLGASCWHPKRLDRLILAFFTTGCPRRPLRSLLQRIHRILPGRKGHFDM